MRNQYRLLNNSFTTATSICTCILIICSKPTMQQKFYRTAVVEYAPHREYNYLPSHILLKNCEAYVKFIEKAAAKKADIIIFPENGLTTAEVNQKVSDHLESYGIEIPATEEEVQANPCDTAHGFHKVIVDLSCAAKTKAIYVVINLVEKVTIDEDQNKYEMYSTNYVFDRNGTIIKKYRKINCHNDVSFNCSHTKQIESFTTDFGVTFGLLIGADILYRKPARELVENMQVTEVIHTTAWSSESPFLNSLSIQHGYAKANRINVLTASLNDPSYNSTGSGIFLSNGSIVSVIISGSKESNILIHNISTSTKNLMDNNCERYDESSKQHEFDTIQHSFNLINTISEDMQNYTFESLDFRNTTIKGCKDNDFCCYNITIDPKSPSASNYVYKIAWFTGARYFGSGSHTKTIGVGICALVACLNESPTSCGRTNASAPNIFFTNISISIRYPLGNNYFQPTTLKHNLLPATDYIYCVRGDETIVKTTNTQSSMLSFGIFGRMYGNDNLAAGSMNYYSNVKQTHREYNEELMSGTIIKAPTPTIVVLSVATVVGLVLVVFVR